MDHACSQEKLPSPSPHITLQANGRRLKVYVKALDKNLYLINPGGRRLSLALKFSLSQHGITIGWKKQAEVWPHDVYLPQIYLTMLSRLGADLPGVERPYKERSVKMV